MKASVVSELFPGFEAIDVHAHFGGSYGYPGSAGGIDECRKLIDQAGFSKVIISSLMAIAYDVPEGNAEVAKAVASDDRLYGSVVFNAHRYDESCEQIKRYADNPRFVSVKYHPSYTGLPLSAPENMRVLELAAERKFPITFHSWNDPVEAAGVARRFPQVPVFWFHSLAASYRKAVGLARELPNVYLEFVTSTQERDKIETLVEGIGADRMVFGTDQALFEPIRTLGALAEARISDEDRRKILSLTARKVFRFDKG